MAEQQELRLSPIEALLEFSELPSSSAPRRRHSRHSPCSSCGCAGRRRKRPSPEAASASLPAKKLFLHQTFDPPSRTISDPTTLAAAAATSPAPSQAVSGSASASLTTPLRRANSDLWPHLAPKSLSSASDELDKTPNSKPRQLITNWRELNLWMEDQFREEQEPSESENLTTTNTTTTTISEDQNNDIENLIENLNVNNDNDNAENFDTITSKEEDFAAEESEETMNVEKDGERMNIHFKCHCGKGYQFLMADGNCFYKLM